LSFSFLIRIRIICIRRITHSCININKSSIEFLKYFLWLIQWYINIWLYECVVFWKNQIHFGKTDESDCCQKSIRRQKSHITHDAGTTMQLNIYIWNSFQLWQGKKPQFDLLVLLPWESVFSTSSTSLPTWDTAALHLFKAASSLGCSSFTECNAVSIFSGKHPIASFCNDDQDTTYLKIKYIKTKPKMRINHILESAAATFLLISMSGRPS